MTTSFSPIGMSIEAASILLEAAGYSVRLAKQGNIHYFLTQDVKINRINLEASEEGYVETFFLG